MIMRLFFLASAALFLISLSGCAPSTRVILLDSGETKNAVVVKTDAGEQVLDQQNTYTVISSATQKPTQTKTIKPQELEQQYGKFIRSAPKPPRKFILYFEPGSTTVTNASEKQFPEIEKAIQERIPCDINIIGHADRTGSKEYNIKLSLQRARKVRAWLQQLNVDLKNVSVESYGEEDPLFPTADGVAEPRNRRVEMLIR